HLVQFALFSAWEMTIPLHFKVMPGSIEGIGGKGRRRNCGEKSGEKLFFVFYQKRRPFFKPGSVRAAAGIVVYRSRQRYEY
ncbi:hypothetical protein ALC62_02797, partial [Cyphomyrmex costatus]